jgi:hypothetical protein
VVDSFEQYNEPMGSMRRELSEGMLHCEDLLSWLTIIFSGNSNWVFTLYDCSNGDVYAK